MRAAAGGVVVALALAATGCGVNTPSTAISTADCADQMRSGGVVYTAYGITDHPARRYATADRADCHDTGTDPRGSVFPDSPDQVATWTFRGYPSDKVLGVRRGGSSFEVFVADSVPPSERDRISQALSDERR